ncbi:hypothetical protein [Pseudomonas sp. D1-2]|uniref:hypothetical protein n=1 Tax=unclassified Pseudomonas TaxID=196821 RepID=UPI003DA8B08B
MRYFIGGGAGMILLIIGHVQAGEASCPALTQLQDDTATVNIQDAPDWQSQTIVQELNPASLQFDEAEFAIQEPDEYQQVSVIYQHCETKLTLDYLTPGLNGHCTSLGTRACQFRNSSDYFSLRF